jgi:hypothetical protein
MTNWDYALVIYISLALVTFIPTLWAIMKKVKLNPDGDGYDKSPFFDEQQKVRLKQHYSRIAGTLGYWKNHAEKYRRFKNYSIVWSICISIIIPVISQEIGEGNSNWFLTVISTHAALLLAFHKGFKVDQNYQSFRTAESEFFDLRRELLDNPSKFGAYPKEQIDEFFLIVSRFRRMARQAEIDNAASINSINKNSA